MIDNKSDEQTQLGDFRYSAFYKSQLGANGKTAAAVDYAYDANGNLTKDRNKDIGTVSSGGIVYNYLNLPREITVQGSTGVKGGISYIYDASGRKLAKRSQTGTTQYVGNLVYENNQLQFILHEEGRIRYKPSGTDAPGTFVYDYFIKDHLGNVRMVLTDELQQAVYPAATLEGDIATDSKPNAVYKEKDYYTINSGYITDRSLVPGLSNFDYANNNGNPPYNNNPYSNTETSSQKVYKLNANTNKTGLGITLKVMTGDKINIFGKSYYHDNNTGGSPVNSTIPVLDIITGLLGTPAGVGADAGGNALLPIWVDHGGDKQ